MSGNTYASYLRVSTTRQAEHDLSIPDQRNQIRDYGEKRNWTPIEEFVDSGASARDDKRPAFQEMIAQALSKPPAFTNIVVHSMSRFMRDEMHYEVYKRRLERNGVTIHSITQDFGEGPAGDFTRRIMALTDEMNSLETAKHVRRTMMENARQGFWNGAAAPLGYRAVVVELRGQKEKKKLEIDPVGAEVIKLIFRLYLDGDGISGPMGTKKIVVHLNSHGYRTPKGNAFHVSYVGRILREEVYAGRFYYNRIDSRTRVVRPRNEWIEVPVPPLVTEVDFQRVQVMLSQRSPKKTAPRLVNSPVVLSGIATCASCGNLMLREYGKNTSYSYYRCSSVRRRGTCEGGKPAGISAPVLDNLVIDRLLDHLLTPERVRAIVAEVAARRAAGADSASTSLAQLIDQRKKTLKKLQNLMDALSEGVVEASETFKATIKSIEADAERLGTLIGNQERLVASTLKALTLEEAALAAAELRRKLETGSAALKKRIVRSLVSQVVVSAEEILIIGGKSDFAEVVTGTPSSLPREAVTGVPTFEREWWTRQGLNL